MKRTIALDIGLILLLTMLIGCHPKEEKSERPNVGDSYCAKFEYVDEENGGYKIITSEIKTLSLFFDNIILIETDEAFSDEWIYRITFDWNKVVVNATEIVILIRADSMSIDSINYTTEEGVDFSQVVDAVTGKYKAFDYELHYD